MSNMNLFMSGSTTRINVLLMAFSIGMFLNLKASDPLTGVIRTSEAYKCLLSDTIPSPNESAIIWEKIDNKEIKIKIEDGVISQLVIDGKVIPKENYQDYPDIVQKYGNLSQERRTFFIESEERFDSDTSHSIQMNKIFSLDSLFNQNPFNRNDNGEWNFEDLVKEFQIQIPDLNTDGFNPDSLFKRFNIELYQDFQNDDSGSNGSVRIYKFDGNGWESLDNFGREWSTDELFNERKNTDFTEVLGEMLNKDGFLFPGKQNRVELSLKSMKINGEKQPSNIHQKYKRLFEETTGTILDKKSKIKFIVKGESRYINRKL